MPQTLYQYNAAVKDGYSDPALLRSMIPVLKAAGGTNIQIQYTGGSGRLCTYQLPAHIPNPITPDAPEWMALEVLIMGTVISDEETAWVGAKAARKRRRKSGRMMKGGALSVPLAVPVVDPELESTSREVIDAGWGYAAKPSNNGTAKKEPAAQWTRPGGRLEDEGVLVKVNLRKPIKVLNFHRRGDYFTTVSPQGQTSAVAIHTLSKHLTQLPFRKLKGLAQCAQFHPSKPIFFVATQRMIRSYDLSKQELLKIIQPGARWISSFDLHPGGDNLIVGSYDRRLLWHDLDLSVRPYKTLRYHDKAIRAVKFHPGSLPLFASCSDDGKIHILHGKVVGDLMENATIVPLKILRGHQIKRDLGVLDVEWHPREPWLCSAGADGSCRLWT